jgi:hypothetical protein
MLYIFLSLAGMSLTKIFWSGIIELFPARESLVSDIPAGDGKIEILFLQCIVQYYHSYNKQWCMETLVHKNLSDEFIYRYNVHRTGDGRRNSHI